MLTIATERVDASGPGYGGGARSGGGLGRHRRWVVDR